MAIGLVITSMESPFQTNVSYQARGESYLEVSFVIYLFSIHLSLYHPADCIFAGSHHQPIPPTSW